MATPKASVAVASKGVSAVSSLGPVLKSSSPPAAGCVVIVESEKPDAPPPPSSQVKTPEPLVDNTCPSEPSAAGQVYVTDAVVVPLAFKSK